MNLPVSHVVSNGLRAQVVCPEEPAKAGVMVLSAWHGIDERIEQTCQWLAAAGFTALAWDPFSAYPTDVSLEERRRLTRGPITDAAAVGEQSHWVGYMREELGLAHVGGMGYCMGGRMGLALGLTESRLECFSAFYPTVRVPVPEYALPVVPVAADIRCHVQVHHAGKDQSMTYDTFSKLRAALETRPGNMETSTHLYPDAEHGFMSDEHQHNPANACAKALAEPQTLAFFRACLG